MKVGSFSIHPALVLVVGLLVAPDHGVLGHLVTPTRRRRKNRNRKNRNGGQNNNNVPDLDLSLDCFSLEAQASGDQEIPDTVVTDTTASVELDFAEDLSGVEFA